MRQLGEGEEEEEWDVVEYDRVDLVEPPDDDDEDDDDDDDDEEEEEEEDGDE